MPQLVATTANLTNRLRADGLWSVDMIAGRPGGATSMNLLADDPAFMSGPWTQEACNAFHNARAPGSPTKYVLNPNLWCLELAEQLSCLVISKDDAGTSSGGPGINWRARYGWLPITRRHVVGCGHAFSHAAGTWGINPSQTTPTRVRWRGSDGETVDRVQLHQAAATSVFSNVANDFGASTADLSIAVLDEDLPDTVYIPRVRPASRVLSDRDTLILSQEWSANSNHEQVRYWGESYVPPNYPRTHRAMLWLSSKHPDAGNFTYSVWGGDSGQPALTVIDGELLLNHIISGDGPYAYPPFSSIPNRNNWTFVSRINALIGVADANAIALGRMTEPTGYTVEVYPDPYPQFNP